MTKPNQDRPQLYVDEHINIYEGKAAEARLKDHSDLAFVDPQTGITRVDQTRWQEAQRYERRTWMEKGRRVLTDRNEYHREHFADYSVLHGRSFQHAIELGCGPFTNMRLIVEHCSVEQIHLLDPLIQDYLSHPSCRYHNGRLGGLLRFNQNQALIAARHPVRFMQAQLNAYRIGGLTGRPVTIAASKIEDYQTSHRFDLVVMINVIEHCQDVYAIFEKLRQITAPGGIFIFHDTLYDASEVQNTLAVSYDAGHPLRVDRNLIDDFLTQHFDSLMRAEYNIEQEFRGITMPRNELYYIGRRRTSENI